MYSSARIKLLSIVYCLLSIVYLSGCASGPLGYFHASPAPTNRQLKLAIIPFANLTTEKDADKKIAYSLITHLLSSDYFEVIEVGEVQKALKDIKARKDEDLAADDIKKIGQLIGADVLLMGVVEEYKIDSSTMLGEKVFVPEAAFSVRLVSTDDASILWAANHHRRGDDRVTIFGMGRIDSISKLTDIIIMDTVNSLTRAMKLKDDALKPIAREINSNARDAAYREKVISKAIKAAAEKKAPKKSVSLENSQVVKEVAVAEKETPASETPLQDVLAAGQEKRDTQKVTLEEKPKDERQAVKEEFQAEYEEIEGQYKQGQ